MKKTIYIPIIVALLTLAFATVSILLYLRKNDARLIKYKLKIGKYLLLLNAMAVGAYAQEEDTGCYIQFSGQIHHIPIIFSVNHINNYEQDHDFKSSTITPDINPEFKTKKGIELGLGYLYVIGNINTTKHFATILLKYKSTASESKRLITNQEYIAKIIDRKNANVFDYRTYDQSNLGLDISWRWHPFDNGLHISGGVFASYMLSSKYSEIIKIKDSSNFLANPNIISYKDDNKSAVLFDDEIKNTNKINYGLKFETGYAFYFKRVTLNPTISYSYSINKQIKNYDWSVHSLNIGLNIIITFIYKEKF